MRATALPILLLHENDPSNHGCAFGHFFSVVSHPRLEPRPFLSLSIHQRSFLLWQTPEDLITEGVYRDIAIAYCPGDYRPTSIALAAKKLGATDSKLASCQGGRHRRFRTANAAAAAEAVALELMEEEELEEDEDQAHGVNDAAPKAGPALSRVAAKIEAAVTFAARQRAAAQRQAHARPAETALPPLKTSTAAYAVARLMFDRHAGEDEFIDADELQLLCKDLGHELKPEQEDLVMSKLDVSGDGVVYADDFVAAMALLTTSAKPETSIEEQMQACFVMFDTRNDGRLG